MSAAGTSSPGPPDEIRLAEILSAVDGPITLGDFGEPHQDGACDHEGQCVLLAVWKQAGDVMRHHLEGYTLATIADIARGESPWPAPLEIVSRLRRGFERRQPRARGRARARS